MNRTRRLAVWARCPVDLDPFFDNVRSSREFIARTRHGDGVTRVATRRQRALSVKPVLGHRQSPAATKAAQ
jgi:hypothetical protein